MKRLCQNLTLLIINELKFTRHVNCPHLEQELSAFDTVHPRAIYLNGSVSNYYLAGMFMDQQCRKNGLVNFVDGRMGEFEDL